jgi:hypothetical protein
VSLVRYELGFYILEDGILHSHRHGNLKSYMPYHVFSDSRHGGMKIVHENEFTLRYNVFCR